MAEGTRNGSSKGGEGVGFRLFPYLSYIIYIEALSTEAMGCDNNNISSDRNLVDKLNTHISKIK